MTLDEAIKNEDKLVEKYEKRLKIYESSGEGYSTFFEVDKKVYKRCAEEHRQLAEWLKELKRLKEQQPCENAISRILKRM